MDDDAMLMVGVSLFLEPYRGCDLPDLMVSVENDIEDYVVQLNEYVKIVDLLEKADDVAAIRERIMSVEFDLRYSMILYNSICERIIFTTTK